MKYQKIIIGIIFLFLLFSCSEELKEAIIGSMEAEIDGVLWSPTTQEAFLKNDAVLGKDILVIHGFSVGEEDLFITLKDNVTGDYELSPLQIEFDFTATYGLNVTETSAEGYVADSGLVTLSSHDKTRKRLSGMFNFRMKKAGAADIHVTNGSFTNVKYIEQ